MKLQAPQNAVEPDMDIQDLIARAQEGDRSSMDRLLEILQPFLERRARRYASSDQGCESTSDLVQEAWLRAWQNLDQFNGAERVEDTPKLFRAWVARIVHSIALNRLRDGKTQRRLPRGRAVVPLEDVRSGGVAGNSPRHPGPSPSVAVNTSDEARLVHEAMLELPDEVDRSIIELRFFEGLSLREISDRLKLSYDRTRERYHASMNVLERRLGGLA